MASYSDPYIDKACAMLLRDYLESKSPRCIWQGTWMEQECAAPACPKHGKPGYVSGQSPTAIYTDEWPHDYNEGDYQRESYEQKEGS